MQPAEDETQPFGEHGLHGDDGPLRSELT